MHNFLRLPKPFMQNKQKETVLLDNIVKHTLFCPLFEGIWKNGGLSGFQKLGTLVICRGKEC